MKELADLDNGSSQVEKMGLGGREEKGYEVMRMVREEGWGGKTTEEQGGNKDMSREDEVKIENSEIRTK